jgi:1,2-diacylglycerol 3-alpha-glucosyltransferase
MKIAIASSGLGHITRGIESWAHDTAHALHARGHDVILCKGAGAPDAEFERVIPCIHRESPRVQRYINPFLLHGLWRVGLGTPYDLEATTFTWNLLKVLRREKIDILHAQDPTIVLMTQRARRAGLVRTRAILGHGTNEPHDVLKKFEFLHHGCPSHLQEAQDQGCYRPTWRAIPNFIPTDTFHPGRCDAMRDELNIPQDAFVLFCASAIKRKHKRVDYLIEEFSQLISSNPQLPAYLVLAGGAEAETDELVQLGRQRLGHRFKPLIGFPRHRIPDLYRAADAFVLCSLREMMPLALLEALASGLPCLVHKYHALEWMVGEGGYVMDMSAHDALANAVHHLATNIEERHRLGRAAREHCLDNFSPDRVIGQILDYYRFALGMGANAGITTTSSSRPHSANRCDPVLSLRD